MNRYFIFMLSCIGIAAWLFTDVPNAPKSLKIPAADSEGGKEREAWEMARLADPATGTIPQNIRSAELAFARTLPSADNRYFRNNGKWQSRGPWNIGGRTRAFAMDISDEKHFLAGSVSGALFISNDAGISWRAAKGIGNNLGVVSITQDKRAGKTNIWYALTGEAFGTSASGGAAFFLGDGMFKSTDNGETWSPLSSTNGGVAGSFSQLYQLGWRVVTDPITTSSDIVYMATYGGIYRSVNGGTSWNLVRGRNTSPYSYFTDIACTTKGVLYATLSSEGTDKGIWRSTDGIAWVNITPSNFPPKYDRIVIGINPNDENEIYFLGNTDGYGHSTKFISSIDWSSLWKYKYKSGNGAGADGEWTNLSDNLPNTGTQFDRFSGQGGYDLVVAVQPNTNNVFIGGTSLWRSTDGFTSPNNTTKIGGYKIGTTLPYFEIYPNHHPDVHDLFFSPSDYNKLYSASDGGLHLTTESNAPFVNWISLNNGYLTTQLYTVMIEPNLANDPTIVGGFQDNGNFFVGEQNPQKSWVQTVNGDGAYGAITSGKQFYYLSIQEGKIAKCQIDKDGKVLGFQRIDPIGGARYQFINPFVLDPNDENTMYVAGGKRIWRNNMLDKIQIENKWDSIATGWYAFPDTIKGTGRVTAIAASKRPANRVYYGSDNGKIYRVDDAHLNTAVIKEITLPSVGNRYVSCITIDPDDANNVIVTYSNYGVYSMFQSKDGGTTWTKVAGNLEGNVNGTTAGTPSLRWLSILKFPNGTKKYFVATSVGLYSTDTLITHTVTSSGTIWKLEGANDIGNVVCNHVATRSSDGLVVVGTHGAGVWAANFEAPNISSAEEVRESVDLQIYPNPTSNVVYWNTTYPFSRKAKVKIFNHQGQCVKMTDFGDNFLELNDLPKGAYLLQIIENQQQALKKLLVQ
jgi:hypothetical protein